MGRKPSEEDLGPNWGSAASQGGGGLRDTRRKEQGKEDEFPDTVQPGRVSLPLLLRPGSLHACLDLHQLFCRCHSVKAKGAVGAGTSVPLSTPALSTPGLVVGLQGAAGCAGHRRGRGPCGPSV